MSVHVGQPDDRRHTCVPIRVAALTETALLRDALFRALAGDASIACVDAWPDAHVVLVDAGLTGSLEHTPLLSPSRVIFVAAPDDDGWALLALESGARGVVLRSASAGNILSAIHSVSEGFIWARRRILSQWIDRLCGRTPADHCALEERLSAREREVLRQTVVGLANKEVAERLAISEATVKVHLTHIFRKLGLHGRAQLAAAYHGVNVPAL